MTKEQLEYHLNKGTSFGFNTESSETLVGWIKLSKRFPPRRFFEIVKEYEQPEAYRAQLKIKNEPYIIIIAQVTRETYMSDKDAFDDDYLINTNYTFRTLDDANDFLKQLGYDLSDLKWTVDFEFL